MSFVKQSEIGIVKLSDGTILKLRVAVVDAREAGFSPFGGIHIEVKPIGGVATLEVPPDLRQKVSDKPLSPPTPPKEGWELVDIVEQKPAVEEVIIDTSKGKYVVRVEAEAVMVSRNVRYRTRLNEPIYWLSWTWKISWRPFKEGVK